MANIGFISLGCAKNQVDCERMMYRVQEAGHTVKGDIVGSDVVVINTCGFIDSAKSEAIDFILQTAALKAEGLVGKILVTGCLSQRYQEEIMNEMPEVDGVLGTGSYTEIVPAIEALLEGNQVAEFGSIDAPEQETGRILTTPEHYAYLRISVGCDNNCTYCVIPEMQGPHRSKTIEQIVLEANELAEQGVTELVLVAQDTTYYGKDLYGRFALVDLLKELAAIESIQWIRLLYAYPNNFTDELIDYIAGEEKICKYLDIPLQHADDEVLRRMNRKITVAEIKALIEKLRAKIPGITLRSTFIVGFPGETEEQYHNLLDFLEEMKLDCVGAFPYSREEGTAADRMDGHLEEDEKEKRAENLMELQYDTMYRKHETAIGQRRLVKVDELSPDIPGLLLCRSEGEAPDVDPWILVFEAEDHDYEPGDYFTVEITGLDEYDFVGEIVDELAE
jgi:ribosomal protein S12 methylthiotransferase